MLVSCIFLWWKIILLASSTCTAKARPAFLGAGATNLNDVLVQSARWSTGLAEVALSRFCRLIYGPKKMSDLQTMCYGELSFFPFYFLPLWCFATIPQLCLLNGNPVYPEPEAQLWKKRRN